MRQLFTTRANSHTIFIKITNWNYKTRRINIARGMGRSYGDSANASKVLQTLYCDHFIEFDEGSAFLQLKLVSLLEKY